MYFTTRQFVALEPNFRQLQACEDLKEWFLACYKLSQRITELLGEQHKANSRNLTGQPACDTLADNSIQSFVGGLPSLLREAEAENKAGNSYKAGTARVAGDPEAKADGFEQAMRSTA